MLKLQLPFRVRVKASASFTRTDRATFRRTEPAKVILEGLSISFRVAAASYDISSAFPQGRSIGPSCGTVWTRCLWQLDDGISIEQQMAIPPDGDALAASWRLIGRAVTPCRLEVRPVFSANEPFANRSFRFEPETTGGRLTWQPLRSSSNVVADTNGRVDPIKPASSGDIVPAAFGFNLGPRPAILIFSSESPGPGGPDPLIGGFLARLSSEPEERSEADLLSNLVAA